MEKEAKELEFLVKQGWIIKDGLVFFTLNHNKYDSIAMQPEEAIQLYKNFYKEDKDE